MVIALSNVPTGLITFNRGPMLNKSMNTSSAAVATYLGGTKAEIDNSTKTVIDVRDCAAVHIAAWEAFPEVPCCELRASLPCLLVLYV